MQIIEIRTEGSITEIKNQDIREEYEAKEVNGLVLSDYLLENLKADGIYLTDICGDVPRNQIITRILEKHYEKVNGVL